MIQPTCLQFGATHSGQIFEARLGLVVSELRQQLGMRICTQVDDLEIKQRHGPAATYLDMLMFIGTMWFYRWQLHFKAKKAEQLWPRNTWTFDGHIIRAFDLQVFSPKDKDQRHRTNLLRFINEQDSGKSTTLRDLSQIVGQQNSHRLSHWPTPYLICATSAFLSAETTRLTKIWGMDVRIWDELIQPLAQPLIGDLIRLLEPREVGDHLRTTGPIVASAVADASGYRVGYQIRKFPDTVLRGSLPLSPAERELHHTIQESIGTDQVARAALLELDLRGTPDQAVVLSSGNDNSAAVKNISNPGNKPQMVLHAAETQFEARRRHVIVVGQKESKYFMDHGSNIDWDGRKQYRYHDLGLQPQLVQAAAVLLGKPICDNTIDMMACRSTGQTHTYVSRFPDGEPGRIPQSDIKTFHLGEDPRLSGKDLYIYPPEKMLETVARQISEQQGPDQSIIIVYPQWAKGHAWMPTLERRIVGSVLVPHDDQNWVHPGGAQRTGTSGRPKWPLIISRLSSEVQTGEAGQPIMPRPFAQLTPTRQGDSLCYRSQNLLSMRTVRIRTSPTGGPC